MNQNAEMLNFIYQNSGMGADTLAQILGIVKDEGMKEHLKMHQKQYQEIHEKAGNLLQENGYEEKDISSFEKISAYIMINLKTIMDKSDSHIAEMLIQGSNMGITDAVKKINLYEERAEKDITSLMKKLLKMEEENMEKMKQYL